MLHTNPPLPWEFNMPGRENAGALGLGMEGEQQGVKCSSTASPAAPLEHTAPQNASVSPGLHWR